MVVAKPAKGKVISVSPTEEDEQLFMNALSRNRIVRYLDDEQKAMLFKSARMYKFAAGDYILVEGEMGRALWVMDTGEVEILYDGTAVKSYSSGRCFGEQSIVHGTKRSASVRAKTKTFAWGVSRADFNKALGASERLRARFEAFASAEEEVNVEDDAAKSRRAVGDVARISNETPAPTEAGTTPPSPPARKVVKLMTFGDFLESLGELPESDPRMQLKRGVRPISAKRLAFLFDLVDQDGSGRLDFQEFAVFDLLVSRPEPEIDIAFMLFDRKRNGMISLDDFRKTMRRRKSKNSPDFDFNSSLIKRYFGSNGKRKLRYNAFTQFFADLQGEHYRQAFAAADSEGTGFLSGYDFLRVIQQHFAGRLPLGLLKRLEDIPSLSSYSGTGVVSYAEFCAFESFVNHMSAMYFVVRAACQARGGPISRDEYKAAAKKLHLTGQSALEVDIIFTLFDVDHDGLVSIADVARITGISPASDVTPETLAEQPDKGPNGFLATLRDMVANFALGAVAGAVGATAVYPIDLIKTRMQNQKSVVGQPRMYANSLDCLRQVLAKEGPIGLYRGLVPQLIGVAPEKAIKLATNDFFRSLFANASDDGSIYFPLEILAGAFAGASQVVFTNPLEIVKIRLQVQGELLSANPGMVRKSPVTIVRELGLSGLYRGAGACLLRDVPFSGIYFPAYAKLKSSFADEHGKLTATDLLLAGAIAGMPAASLVTPADVIKTRLQVETPSGEKAYRGIVDCSKAILRDEGVAAFFKGAGARVFRSSPQFGVTLLSYELLHQFLIPDISSKPPTNAPVTEQDLRQFSLLGTSQTNKLHRVSDTMKNMSLK